MSNPAPTKYGLKEEVSTPILLIYNNNVCLGFDVTIGTSDLSAQLRSSLSEVVVVDALCGKLDSELKCPGYCSDKSGKLLLIFPNNKLFRGLLQRLLLSLSLSAV
jgi:hypothetical protein